MPSYDQVLERWPLLVVTLVLTVVGQFTSKRLFTRERAYHADPKWFWYWGRETLPLHPFCAAGLIALTWPDPEGHGWSAVTTFWYFQMAAFGSLFMWIWLRARAKRHGLDLVLPGDTERPPPGAPPKPMPPLPDDRE